MNLDEAIAAFNAHRDGCPACSIFTWDAGNGRCHEGVQLIERIQILANRLGTAKI